jgi:hypothetical protein
MTYESDLERIKSNHIYPTLYGEDYFHVLCSPIMMYDKKLYLEKLLGKEYRISEMKNLGYLLVEKLKSKL